MARKNREEQVYAYVKEYIESHGYPPSIREICRAVNLASPSSVHTYLKRLEDKGILKQEGSKKRALRLADDVKANAVSVPLVGTVAAGVPILATENVTANVAVPSFMATSGEQFLLSVQGDSMIDAGILDGDYVLVKRQNTAENGQIVVALLQDSATVKAFYKEKEHIRLEPRNSSMQPIIAKHVDILGVVCGVMRRYNV